MKARTLLVALVAAVALGAVPATSIAAAAPGKVTIDTWQKGLFGYVQAKHSSCAAQRQVIVYKQLGEAKDPATDRQIGAAKAAKTRAGYRWSVTKKGKGAFYATATATPKCAAATSRALVDAPGLAYDDRLCGPYSGPGWCRLTWPGKLHFQTEYCTSFSKSSGDCRGGSSTGSGNWPFVGDRHALRGEFQWSTRDGKRQILYFTHKDGEGTGITHLGGTLPNAGSDQFTVTDGYAQRSNTYGDGPHFETPVVAGAGPGEQGGPLGFDFSAGSGFLSSEDVYIWGWLYRK